MEQLHDIETALTARIRARLAAFYQDADSVSVEAAPGGFSNDFLDEIFGGGGQFPAVRVGFGGAYPDPEGNALTLIANYAVWVFAGCEELEPARRRQAVRIVERIATDLNGKWLGDLADMNVASIENFYTGVYRRIQVAIYEIGVNLKFELEHELPPGGDLDEFLQAGMRLGTQTQFDIREDEG